jgi:hypothetical protein
MNTARFDLVPVPTTAEWLNKTAPHWLPFLPGISRRSKEPIESLLNQIGRFEVQLALVWDNGKAQALVGIRLVRRGEDLIGEIVWLTGNGMRDWLHLLPQLEQYLKQHLGCVAIRPICRPGWSRLIKGRGYKITHFMMEKPL